MFKRIIVALIGIPLAIAVVAIDNMALYYVAMTFFSVVGMYELLGAARCFRNRMLAAVTLGSAVLFPSMLYFTGNFGFVLEYSYCYLAIICLVMITTKSRPGDTALVAVGSAAIPTSFFLMLFIREENGWAVGAFGIVTVFLCTWMADAGGYFVGRAIGKRRLAPHISPKKSVEGFVGGLVFSTVSGVAAVIVFDVIINRNGVYMINIGWMAGIGLLCGLLGTLGDLAFSAVKRQYRIKDFGKLLGAHGGILDRFDSVLFTIPIVYKLIGNAVSVINN